MLESVFKKVAVLQPGDCFRIQQISLSNASAEVSFKSSQDLATPFITNPLDIGRKLSVCKTFKDDQDVF